MARVSNAVKVAKNTKPLAASHNALAKAFNSRILSGMGDCAWRIYYYAYSTFRALRNPDGTNYPAQDEWFKFYAYLEPKAMFGKFGWPEAPAGEAQGPNVANPFMAWLFGNNSRVKKANGIVDETKERIHGYWSEPIRLGGIEIDLPQTFDEGPITKSSGHPRLSQIWYDSQYQRGCCAFVQDYKYLNGNNQIAKKELQLLSLGVVGAARRHLKYVMETASMGRYAPSFVPDVNGKGGIFRKKNAVRDQIDQAMFYYLSFFRGVEDQRAKHNKISPTVTDTGFNFEIFFSKQFLLAPNYAVPKYELDQNGKPFIDPLGNKKIKYDNIGYPELFPETTSFLLSLPLKDGNSYNKIITPTNPSQLKPNSDPFTFKGSGNITAFNTNPQGSQDRFCLAALFIQTSDIAAETESDSALLLDGMVIDIYVNDKFYTSIPIGQESRYKINIRTGTVNNNKSSDNRYQLYQFNKIFYFEYPLKGQIGFRLRCSKFNGSLNIGKKVTQNNSGGTTTYSLGQFSIFLNFAHVFQMKPSVADAYTVMRVATTEGAGRDAGQMDPVGHFNGDMCKKVFDNYYKFGVAYTLRKDARLYQNDSYVSANPVYESIRKFISSNIKMADRVTLVDYEINSGKSVLYFLRYAYGMKNTGVDIFRGLGPSVTQVGNRAMVGSNIEQFIPIVKGKRYIVLDIGGDKTNYVLYKNSTTSVVKYSHGQILTGSDFYYVSSYSSPTVGVYELDGITSENFISSSPKLKIKPDGKNEQYSNGNISNEWSMFMSYNLYHWSNSSYWKPEMYGDVMGALNARCLTSSDALENNRATSRNIKLHLANVTSRPLDIPLIVEGPSGYSYIENANTDLSKTGNSDPNYIKNFTASCKIYKAPYKILSATRVNQYDPSCEIIKITLDTRLTPPNINGSPATFSGKVSENLSDYINKANSFEFRTDESAVIDYILHVLTKRSCPRGVVGDVALDNNRFWSKQRPFGCCYPRFYFVKLIPLVSSETVMYSDHYMQMEYYLRAMCNGFVNKSSELSPSEIQGIISSGLTSINTPGGYDSAVGDYLFEDLMRKSYDISSNNSRPISPTSTSNQ